MILETKVNYIILNKKTLNTELDLNFHLIAITSQLKDYRLCFLINKTLNMSFERTEFDYSIVYNGFIPKFFSQYYFKSSDESDFYVISNRGEEGILMPELRETDYFILIKNHFDEEELAIILAGLKQIKDIQVAVLVNPKKIKSIESLIF